MLLIGFFSSRETLFLLLALRKQPPCIHTVCICWLLKEVLKAFSVPLHLAPNCTYLHPSYPYTKASQVFIFYLALAARSFIPFDFFFFHTLVLQLPSHRPCLKVFFMYEISFHFLEEISQKKGTEGWGRKRKDRNSELHAPMQLSFASQKWQAR